VFTNVLVGVDDRPGARDAIALAEQLVGQEGHITLVHVYGGAWMIGSAAALVLPAGRDFSEGLLAGAREATSVKASLVSWPSRSVGRGLHEVAERRHSDLLVVGSHGRGVLETVLTGNRTLRALNGAPCAVAIAPGGYAEQAHRLAQVGVGHDGSSEGEQALAAARALAARHGSAITAMSVVSLQSIPGGNTTPPPNWTELTQRLILEERRRLQSLEGIDGDAVYGDPGDELAHFGENLDLLIVGSRGYGPVGRLLEGSTSRSLARHPPCPLLVVPRAAAAQD
jgi:nucleotide-binding universal stress UspA family protein